MTELGFGMVPNIFLHLMPVAGIIPDLLAVGADRQAPFQFLILLHQVIDEVMRQDADQGEDSQSKDIKCQVLERPGEKPE